MSNIKFTMKDLDGTVMPYTSFVISTSTSANAASFTTNLNGQATVSLAAVSTPYYISKQDGTTESVIAYKFFVPDTTYTLDAELLFVDMGKISKDKNDKSIAALIEAKVVAVNAANRALQAVSLLGNVSTIRDNLDSLVQVANSVENVVTVANNIESIVSASDGIASISSILPYTANIATVANRIEPLVAVGNNINNINDVRAMGSDIAAIADNIASITDAAAAVTQAVDAQKELYIAGTHYTRGVSATLNLSYTPAKTKSVKIFFDGIYQNKNTFTRVGTAITFSEVLNVYTVEIHYEVPSQFVSLDDGDNAVLVAAQNAAQASANAAAASFDSFDDRYLGAKAVAPTFDNDGNVLLVGAKYFNSTENKMYVRNSSNAWQLDTADSSTVNYLPAGTGAVATDVQSKLRESVSVKDFGAVGDGVTDDTAAIQKALDYAGALPNGGTVIGGAGIILGLGSPLSIPTGVTFDLTGTTLRPVANIGSAMLNVLTGFVTIFGGTFSNNSSFASSAIGIDKARDDNPVYISKCYFGGFNTRAIEAVSGSNLTIENNMVVSCGVGFDLGGVINCYIRDNYILGSSGIKLNYSGLSNEGIDISGNKILPASGAYALAILQGFEITVSNNIFDQIITGSGVILDGTSYFIDTVKLRDNFIGRQFASADADYGLYVYGNVRNLLSAGNTYVGWQQAGIYINGEVENIIEEFCSRDDTFYVGDTCVIDIKIEYCRGAIIDGATFNASVANINENSGVEGVVTNCRFNTNIPSISLGLRYGSQAAGMTLRNKGTATIVSAGTAVVVNHQLSYTPDLGAISLVYGSSATNDPSPMRVVVLTSTEFTIAPKIAPGSDVLIGWSVDMTR